MKNVSNRLFFVAVRFFSLLKQGRVQVPKI